MQPLAASPAGAEPAPASAVTAASEPVARTNVWKRLGIAALSLGAVGFITWGVGALVADSSLSLLLRSSAGVAPQQILVELLFNLGPDDRLG